MFGVGMPEMIVILAIALIVLGPKKLPEIAKSLGRGIAEFKKATQDFKQSIDTDKDLKQAKETLQDIKGNIQESVRQTMAPDAKTGALSAEEEDDEDDASEDEDEPLVSSQKPADQSSSVKAKEEEKEKGPSKDA
jgi:TatA/E family protein of Tat protein translocase